MKASRDNRMSEFSFLHVNPSTIGRSTGSTLLLMVSVSSLSPLGSSISHLRNKETEGWAWIPNSQARGHLVPFTHRGYVQGVIGHYPIIVLS